MSMQTADMSRFNPLPPGGLTLCFVFSRVYGLSLTEGAQCFTVQTRWMGWSTILFQQSTM